MIILHEMSVESDLVNKVVVVCTSNALSRQPAIQLITHNILLIVSNTGCENHGRDHEDVGRDDGEHYLPALVTKDKSAGRWRLSRRCLRLTRMPRIKG